MERSTSRAFETGLKNRFISTIFERERGAVIGPVVQDRSRPNSLGLQARYGGPVGLSVLSHVDGARHIVALHCSFEVAPHGISSYRHHAVKFDLVTMDDALELRVVDLTVVFSGNVASRLLENELLVACAAEILNRHAPGSLHLGGRS